MIDVHVIYARISWRSFSHLCLDLWVAFSCPVSTAVTNYTAWVSCKIMIMKDKDKEWSDYVLLYVTNRCHSVPKQNYPHDVKK